MQDQTWELISAVIWQRLGRYDGSRSSHNTSIHIPKNNRSRMNQRCQEFVFWERSVVLNPMLRFDFHAQKSDCDCTWHILFDAWSYPQDEVFLNKESAADDLLQEQKALWAWPWSLWVCSSFFFKQSTAIPNFFFLHSDNFSMAVTWLWVTSLLDKPMLRIHFLIRLFSQIPYFDCGCLNPRFWTNGRVNLGAKSFPQGGPPSCELV